MKTLFYISLILLTIACQKEHITLGTSVSETLYVQHKNSAMRVLIEGNTTSKAFLLMVHGGPGTSSFLYNTPEISEGLENQYAVVYWDQRNAGASQGGQNISSLSLSNMTEDLEQVILVLKARYGQDVDIFLHGHSFGGLLSASFVTPPHLQALISGWIVTGGSHNYPLNNDLSRKMLIDIGTQEISNGNHVEQWQNMVNYCTTHSGELTLDEANTINGFSADAETLIKSIEQVNLTNLIVEHGTRDKWPISSVFLNWQHTTKAAFNENLAQQSFSPKMHQVTVPVLLLFGQYDFICPKGLGEDIFKLISSDSKTMMILEKSGHSPMFQEPKLFSKYITDFIALHH